MKPGKARLLMLMMTVTIVLVTGFQLFWLKKNFDEEKRSLAVQAGMNFRQTVYNLQAQQFRTRLNVVKDSNINFKVLDGKKQVMYFDRSDQVVGMVNEAREQVTRPLNGHYETFIIRSDSINVENIRRRDSVGIASISINKSPQKTDRFIQLISGIDSARDSLKVKEIIVATKKTFARENINVPFNVARIDSVKEIGPLPMEWVTVGFAEPVSYKIDLGNAMPYLLKKLISPILFSFFLLTITIASFVLMYRTLKQQQKLAALKNDFISNVTHELKTPIATVNVALEALKNFNAINDPQRTREYLDISQQELQRLSLLVDKVLRVSMFEDRKVELKQELFNMENLVNDVKSSMKLQFEKQGALVTVDTDGGDMNIRADKFHMMSVIYNLFDNALKYSKGKPEIKVAIKTIGNSLDLRITDNGIGIPEEYRGKIFDKFFRVPHGDVHNVKGYGLGLSYVAHIIQEHSGTIRVEPARGSGTTFIINLPKDNA